MIVKPRFNYKARHFFHLTNKKWGKEIILKPKTTDQLPLPNRCDNEPDVPKICVALTVEGCLIALANHCWYSPIQIYRTAEPVQSVKPWEVDDADITGERWITQECKFVQVGHLNKVQLLNIRNRIMKDVGYFVPGCVDHLRLQKQALKIIEKYLEFP